MSAVGARAAAAPARAWPIRAAARVLAVLGGILLGLTPITALLVLGWLMRYTRREIVVALTRGVAPPSPPYADWPAWLGLRPGERAVGARWPARTLGALGLNLSLGVRALAALGAVTLPYGLAWMAAWWAGWENSFNKGYEQAPVGALVALAGIAVAPVVLIHLPLAQAHLAAEQRLRAFFELRRIRELVVLGGWGNVWLALLHLAAAVPLLAATGAPTFIEGIYPDFADLDAAGVEAFRGRYRFWAACYVFLALLVLRRAGARVYARAVRRRLAAAGPGDPWRETFAAGVMARAGVQPLAPARPRPVGRLVRAALCAGCWLAFVGAIFVGQFLNHDWPSWINHPLVQLPWFAPLS